MKVPPKRKGNAIHCTHRVSRTITLNESPSEKEGKYDFTARVIVLIGPSMKVPPKRKGNTTA